MGKKFKTSSSNFESHNIMQLSFLLISYIQVYIS